MCATKMLQGKTNIKKKIDLEYYIIESDGYVIDNNQYKMYGIEIIKNENNENGSIIESNAIYDISTHREFVDDIVQKLIRNQVTPITLFPILEDIL